MSKISFLTRYSQPKKVSIINEEPSLTDESFKQECDLGFILETYAKTGHELPQSTMNYVDCTTVSQFEDAMQLVAEANSNFECLPAKERDRFKTVENYLAFICDANNLKESYEKGYIDPSSVDLADVYPEQFGKVQEDITPVPEPVSDVSVTPSTESAE